MTDKEIFSEKAREKRLYQDAVPYLAAECHIHTTPSESWLLYSNEKENLKDTGLKSMVAKKISHEQEEIIFTCDGRTTVRSIANIMKKVFGIKERDTIFTLEWLLNEGILELSNEMLQKPTFPSFGGSRDYFVPLHIFLELTDYCNQRCKHCYLESEPTRNSFADTNSVIRTVENLAIEGTLAAEITGGEPTSHPDFKDILTVCAEFFQVTSVITNGTLLTDDIIKLISDLKQNGNSVLVSITINSFDENYHDGFVNLRGSFRKALNSIKKLSAAGIPVRATMNVTKNNLPHIRKTAEVALDAGADVFAVAPVNFEGRARTENICLTDESEWAEFDREFLLLKKDFGERVFSLPEPQAQEIHSYSCGAGTKTLAISPEGLIRPCVLFEKEASLGNIFEKDIEELLKPEKLGIFNGDFSPAKNGCDRCKFSSYCNGCVRRMLEMSKKYSDCRINSLIK